MTKLFPQKFKAPVKKYIFGAFILEKKYAVRHLLNVNDSNYIISCTRRSVTVYLKSNFEKMKRKWFKFYH